MTPSPSKKPARIRWTDALIASSIQSVAAELGRMPTTPELRARGLNALACKIGRTLGFSGWADRLGLSLSGAETHRGQAIEAIAKAMLEKHGFSVERQTAIAPFDLLVDGSVRVDVKSAKFSQLRAYGKTRGRAHVFHLAKAEPTCDLYLLCGVDSENEPLWFYFVPATHAKVQTISISPRGKYTRFKGAIGELETLVKRTRDQAA